VQCSTEGSGWTEAINIRDYLAGKFTRIPGVDTVLVDRDGNTMFRIYTVVSSSDRELRRKVYGVEKSIIDEFPEMEFDFSVSSRSQYDRLPSM